MANKFALNRYIARVTSHYGRPWERDVSDSSDHGSPFGASLKVEVKTEVPAESAGRTVDAMTDLLRPFSEGLGYVGDLIRLQREKVLREIAKRAKERLDSIDGQPKPIPQKFFVPLLQKASLESLDDTILIDMWANLIVTAATSEVQMLGQYVEILSHLVPAQVRILDKMLDCADGQTKSGHLIDNHYILNQTGLPNNIAEFADIEDAEEFADSLIEALSLKGVAIDCINVFYRDKRHGDGFSVGSPDGIYSDAQYFDFENLVRLGLIERVEVKQHKIGRFDIDVHYYTATPVGIDLFACCNPTRLLRAG